MFIADPVKSSIYTFRILFCRTEIYHKLLCQFPWVVYLIGLSLPSLYVGWFLIKPGKLSRFSRSSCGVSQDMEYRMVNQRFQPVVSQGEVLQTTTE